MIINKLNEEYILTTKDVVNILNTEYNDLFDIRVDSRRINYWIQNYEINAFKNEKNRWLFTESDVLDFVYRYEHNFLHHFNNYYKSTIIKVSTEVLYDIFQECELVFQKIVCILTTLHPYALFNDPLRKYSDLCRHEGGIIFKEAAITFHINGVSPKGNIRKQRLFYPIIVTKVIEEIITEYNQTQGSNVTDRLINTGFKLINGKITHQEYLDELDRNIFFSGWRGLVRNYDSIPGNELIFPKKKF